MINCTYLHIPFCKKKCNYCAFCSFAFINRKGEYIKALIEEIKFHYKNEYQKTIYFGGGTPSILEITDIEKILNCFNYDENTSITFEMNPNDVNENYLKELKKLGINRISLGIQNFDDEILKILNRSHDANTANSAIKLTKKYFDDFSIDLMYGLPSQTMDNWSETLDKAIKYNIPHISLYGLKIEKNTKFDKFLPENLPDMDIQAKMYELAVEKLSKYIHYEFSNFAINKKYFSKHNLAYWKRENYYGFGLSASGFIENKRYTNVFKYPLYIKNPTQRNFEELTYEQQIEEELFLGLRIRDGIDFSYINKKYNIDIYQKYKKIFDKYLNLNYFEKTEKGIKLTINGILLSNEILCEFIEI